MSMTVENVRLNDVVLERGDYRDEVLTFTGAGTVVEGTLLARDNVSLKMVPFVKGGTTNGNGIPSAVATSDITATAAGDIPFRAMLNGKLRKSYTVIDADGDDSNIDAAVIDACRSFNLVIETVQELSVLDNQ